MHVRAVAISLLVLASLRVGAAPRADEAQILKLTTDASLAVMGRCGARLWPGYDWKKIQVALVGEASGATVAIDSVTSRSIRLADGVLPPEAYAAEFSFFSYLNQDWMALNLASLNGRPLPAGELAEELFGVGAHEAFHRIVQPFWTGKPAGSRGTAYPIQFAPRLERRMLFERLREAFLNPASAPAALAKASFWFHKWKTAFPREVVNLNATKTSGLSGRAFLA